LETFILVHGAWHDGTAWDPTVLELSNNGHKAYAPTIAGHGKGVNKRVNHADCTKSIVDYIVAKDLSNFVLVGHSFGGTVISKVAEAVPHRIKRLVFLNAFVLRDGHSLNDESPPQNSVFFDRLAAESTDNTLTIPFPVWRDAFINDADLEVAKWAYSQLSPQPYQPCKDKLDLKKFYSLGTPKSYINCTEDISLPPGEWGWHPRMSSRLGLPPRANAGQPRGHLYESPGISRENY
jgi:pimeloyl-ACP methyl ester carboxylesterase